MVRSTALLACFSTVTLIAALGCGGSENTTGSGGAPCGFGGCAGSGGGGAAIETPPWLSDARILVSGQEVVSDDCRNDICRHNENTDLVTWKGATWLVHRTAHSQVLGPNSSLHVYRSDDGGKKFVDQATIQAPPDRDLRDPHFYVVNDQLFIKALTRLPVNSTRDSDVQTIAVLTTSSDGKAWSPLAPIGPETWSFWRIKEHAGVYYTAAYEDGDKSVVLFTSTDGMAWTMGNPIYTISVDTPLETELTFMPSGKLLALVRMDGNDDELLGDVGRLRTKICWSDPPYDVWDCPAQFDGQRLDGPLSFFHDGRLFVVARKHLGADDRKRTALFEITGDLEGGALSIMEHGELPSAGDTSYAGVADVDATHALLTWYSGNLQKDEGWAFGIFDITDIWQGTVDFSKLP